MRAHTFAGQVIAVLSRRASAFENDPAEPQTFPGRIRALFSRHGRTETTRPGQALTHEQSPMQTENMTERRAREQTGLKGQHTSDGAVEVVEAEVEVASEVAAAADILDLSIFHTLARKIAGLKPDARLHVRTNPAYIQVDRDLERARARARALARALDRARDRALARDLAGARARALALDRDLDRALIRDLDLALIRDLDLALDRARARALDLDLDRARTALDWALHDFTGADLRDVDLTNVELEGLRWSPATRWPQGWADQLALDSVEVAPGMFEIRRGTAPAPV